MKGINDMQIKKKDRPIKVLQFGEGNFLRAFADYMIDIANEKGIFNGNVAIVKPVDRGSVDAFNAQNCNYTVVLRGKQNNEIINSKRIVTSVAKAYDARCDYEKWMSLAESEELRLIISNTTEAGIVLDKTDSFEGLPKSYPGKLTKFLYKRYRFFNGDNTKGLIMLPVELIEDNGDNLKKCVIELSKIFDLPENFRKWLDNSCIFCNTLVDRIVTGAPKGNANEIYSEIGYEDKLVDIGEPFGLWVIESKKDISGEFPLDKADMPVIFTDNQKPYHERKVRVLNGAHTSFVLAAYLCGFDIVRNCVKDEVLGEYIKKTVKEEIVPFVPLSKEECISFAESVFERFENPFIEHSLLAISLNSISKWKARVLPSFCDYYKEKGKIPKLLTFSFAALISFYRSHELREDGLYSQRKNGDVYVIHDDANVLKFFAENASKSNYEYARAIAENTDFWGKNLSEFNGFIDSVSKYIAAISDDPLNAVKMITEER